MFLLAQFKKATKNASQIVDIILEDKNFIPGGNEKLIESLVSLTLLYTLKVSKIRLILDKVIII